MKKNGEAYRVLAEIKKLSSEERQEFVDHILKLMNESEAKDSDDKTSRQKNDEKPDCPHCGGAAADGYIVRRGINKNGSQRYCCKACGRFFVPTTGTMFAHTHKDITVWRQFISLTVEGATLAVCAKECNLAFQTAFNWRHKVLNALKTAQKDLNPTGGDL